MKPKLKVFQGSILALIIFITLMLSTIFVTIALVLAPSVPIPDAPDVRIKGDYVLMLMQCIIGVFAMLLPGFLKKRLSLVVPSKMLLLYAIFLYCAIYLGEVRAFYYNVPHWDTVLHTFSGAMLGALGFSFVNFLNKTENIPFNLSPLFVAVFTFCFAVALGVIWEVYEYSADVILKTNMQKFGLENGTPFVGQAALSDTMKDLIVDCVGAAVISIVGYVSLKYRKGWVEKLQLKIKKKV